MIFGWYGLQCYSFQSIPVMDATVYSDNKRISLAKAGVPPAMPGGTQSLTYTGVHRETATCEPPKHHKKGETQWTKQRH